ncbi:MAG: FHA domain-containing protein [Planctomycetota bacterium]|jgi:pSer/pThr/pTyr-binding forkhead associated (FHA) protein
MRMVVKQKDGNAREFQFAEGPVSIGRGANSQIFLPDRAASRQHAVIHSTDEGKWVVEDLGSASKTYLNDAAIQKAEIKHGDCLRITDFIIEIILEEAVEIDKAMQLEAHETVVRTPDAGHAPAMRLAARRLTDFSQATETICEAGNLDELLLTLLNVTLEQFNAFHVWCALRKQPTGPMTCHAGKKQDGKTVDLSQIKLQKKVIQAVEKGQFLVMPRVSAQIEEEEAIRSALIAAIIRPTGCFGVLYVDNAMKEKHYSLSDLDYLMLLAMHTAAILKKFLD